MKYIAVAITGYVLMARDIEVEIDEAKLEAALKKETHEDEDWWEGKPADELWIYINDFAYNFMADYDEIKDKADAIVEEWEALPDCAKVRDCGIEENDWNDSPYLKACKEWLRSKGWAPLPDEDDIWFRKK